MTLIAVVADEQLGDLDALALYCEDVQVTPSTKSKKAFAAYVEGHQDEVVAIDPSARFGFVAQPMPLRTPRMALGEVVTNHPKRTWFGMFVMKNGKVTVK